jgi:hypothetical protein
VQVTTPKANSAASPNPTFDFSIRTTDVIMILAVFVGPIAAILVGEKLRKKQEREQRRLKIFKTLMATRNAQVSPNHIEALNMVDTEFDTNDKQDKKIVDCWKLYLAHLGNLHTYQSGKSAWGTRKIELLFDLLYEMSHALGYNFDRSHITLGAYYPQVYVDAEMDSVEIRKLLLEILKHQRTFPISATSAESPPSPNQLEV